MPFTPIEVDRYENTGREPVTVFGLAWLAPRARILRSRLLGPIRLSLNSQVGVDAVIGKYVAMNDSCYVARTTVGSYCTFGARNAINPFNHPMHWLSIHEFQYNPATFDWIDEYKNLQQLERTPEMFQRVTIGNDVWTGHNVNILPGVAVGDGAVIGAGSVVTKDVPPYAIVAGAPAQLRRHRFSEKIIERLLRAKWWDLELSELSGLPFRDIERCLDRLEEIRGRKSSA